MDREDEAYALLDSVTTAFKKEFVETLDLRISVDREHPYPRVQGEILALVEPPKQRRLDAAQRIAVKSTFNFVGPDSRGECTTSTSALLWTPNGWKDVHNATVLLNRSPDWVEPVLRAAEIAATIAHLAERSRAR